MVVLINSKAKKLNGTFVIQSETKWSVESQQLKVCLDSYGMTNIMFKRLLPPYAPHTDL